MTSPEPFGGRIGRSYQDSEPWWPSQPATADGQSPNVVTILFDDMGFSHLGCYGSTISTPNIDALAANGLRFSNFHVTALCSPTRASLLTGRNHHAVGMRAIANYDSGYPNMRGAVTPHAATLAEMLRDEGYATLAIGKWHLNPTRETSAAGPFASWPLQRGFDRYYGFLGGATDQFYPELTYDNHHIDPPASPEEGYHVTEDLVDHAISFVNDHRSIYPRRPFFLYFALGATHSPHQAPQEYIDRYRGKFDAGWDATRQEWYTRQLDSGIIPQGTQLAPRNPGVRAWEELSSNAQKFMATLQEAFAGFLEHSDAQIGRLVRHLDESGQLDNTILILLADNGASQEGGPQGVSETARYGHPHLDDLEEVQSRLEDIGGPRSSPNYPWGWAQAGNTPLKWYKQNTHGGGVRVPMIVHWPDRIATGGGIRHQFHHVSDVVPTVLELLGMEAPENYHGYDQMPVTGTSFAYAFDEPDAPSQKRSQYFEMLGHRGIYADGWKAVTHHEKNDSYDDEEWELYHVAEDFSESNDLAQEHPTQLRELVDLWWVEAGRNGVLPLDDRSFQMSGIRRPGGIHEGHRYHYTPPMSRIPSEVAPPMGMGPWTLTADIERDSEADEGVIFSRGSISGGGMSLYVRGNRLHFDYSSFGDITVADSSVDLPVGRLTVGVQMHAEAVGAPGTVTFTIDGEEAGTAEIPMIMRSAGGLGVDIGRENLSPVTSSYEAPFAFTGTIHAVDLEITAYPKEGAAYEAARTRFREIMAQQ